MARLFLLCVALLLSAASAEQGALRKLLKKPDGSSDACVPFNPGPPQCTPGTPTSLTVSTKGYHLYAGGYYGDYNNPDSDGCYKNMGLSIYATNEPYSQYDPVTGLLCTRNGAVTVNVAYSKYCPNSGTSTTTNVGVAVFDNDASKLVSPKKLPTSISGSVPGQICSDACTYTNYPPACTSSCTALTVTLSLSLEALAPSSSNRCKSSLEYKLYGTTCTEQVKISSNVANFNGQLSGSVAFTNPDPSKYGDTPEPVSFISSTGNTVTAFLTKEATIVKGTITATPPSP